MSKKLKTNTNHTVFYSISGADSGVPVFSFHGGPGDGSSASHLKRFDLDQCQVVQIDQRGCGKSTPLGEIAENTTDHLLEDIENIRQKLGFQKIVVSGGSWGATLALLYAEKYPDKVSGIYLRSPSLARKEDIQKVIDLDENSAKNITQIVKPGLYEDYKRRLAEELGLNSFDMQKLWELITSADLEQQKIATKYIMSLEYNFIFLDQPWKLLDSDKIDESFINSAKIYLHYLKNNFFLSPNQVLENINKIKLIPTAILQGRYDLLCPVADTLKLHQSLENSVLEISETSAHKLSADANQIGYYLFKDLLARISL